MSALGRKRKSAADQILMKFKVGFRPIAVLQGVDDPEMKERLP